MFTTIPSILRQWWYVDVTTVRSTFYGSHLREIVSQNSTYFYYMGCSFISSFILFHVYKMLLTTYQISHSN